MLSDDEARFDLERHGQEQRWRALGDGSVRKGWVECMDEHNQRGWHRIVSM